MSRTITMSPRMTLGSPLKMTTLVCRFSSTLWSTGSRSLSPTSCPSTRMRRSPVNSTITFWGGSLAACALPCGNPTWAADSIATAAPTMKMISRTRKMSVSGVILISPNKLLSLLLGIAMWTLDDRPRSLTQRALDFLDRRAPGRDRDLVGAGCFGDSQYFDHVGQNYFAVALKHHYFRIDPAQRVVQGALQLRGGNILGIDEYLVIDGVGDDNPALFR